MLLIWSCPKFCCMVKERSLLKILWEKEKMLVTSILSLSHVFYLSQNKFQFLVFFILSSANAFNVDQTKILLFNKGLTLSQTSPGFYVSAIQVFRKHCGKGEIACNEQFLLFPYFFFHLVVSGVSNTSRMEVCLYHL